MTVFLSIIILTFTLDTLGKVNRIAKNEYKPVKTRHDDVWEVFIGMAYVFWAIVLLITG